MWMCISIHTSFIWDLLWSGGFNPIFPENQELNVEDVQPVKFAPLMIQGLECRLAILFRNRMSWMHCGRLMEPEWNNQSALYLKLQAMVYGRYIYS